MSKELHSLDLVAMGKRIRSTREARKLTREELAEKVELSPQFIADVEYGNKGVSISTLYQLAQVLNVSADYFLSGKVYDFDNNDTAAKTCEDINELLKSFDMDALEGFREISRIYVDTLNKIKEQEAAPAKQCFVDGSVK